MESRLQLTSSGQSVYQADINLLGENSALADDRVLAELFRIAPNAGAGVAKAVIPYRVSGLYASSNQTIVAPGTGKVIVNPFRALVGSRTLAAAGGLANWRDIRSAIHVGTTTLYTEKTFANCGAGVYRWDLVYANVAVDANYVTANRKVKDGATGNVTTSSLVTQVKTTVTIEVAPGTAAVSPSLPALPADDAAGYKIPLAYVRIPANYTAATVLTAADIWEVSPQIAMSSATGAASVRVANGNFAATGAVQTRSPWTGTTRPPAYLPSTMAGSEELLIAVDLTTGSVSHNSGDILDNTRDWRGRVWHGIVVGLNGANQKFPWAGVFTDAIPGIAAVKYESMGQTIAAEYSTADAAVMSFGPSEMSAMASGSAVKVYVPVGSAGTELRISYSGAPNCRLFFWLRASSAFANA